MKSLTAGMAVWVLVMTGSYLSEHGPEYQHEYRKLTYGCGKPELVSTDRLNVPVHLGITDPEHLRAFSHAMKFWQQFLDLTWYPTDRDNCAIDVELMATPGNVGESHLTKGILALSDTYEFTYHNLVLTYEHELGHFWGLDDEYKKKDTVMWWSDEDGIPELINASELAELAGDHRLAVLRFE